MIKECLFYVETCFMVIFGNVSTFCYNDNGLDGTCGYHGIWRRWGRYHEQSIEEMSFLCSLEAYSKDENIDVSTLYKKMYKQ